MSQATDPSQTYFSPRRDAARRFQCRQIHLDGHRCGSACIRGEEFCYYHNQGRQPIPAATLEKRKFHREAFILPRLEDRSAIQYSIGEVLQRIAANDIDPRRGGLLLYGLQIAALNVPRPKPGAQPAPSVQEVVLDPIHGPIAARSEFGKAEEELGPAQRLFRKPGLDRAPPTKNPSAGRKKPSQPPASSPPSTHLLQPQPL